MTDQPPGYQPPGYPPPHSGGFPSAGYQGTGYPTSGPFPAHPGSGPFPAQPGSGPFPAQTGGFPAQNPPPRPKMGAAVPVLAAVMVVFLAAAAVMVFLWMGAADAAKAENGKLTEATTALSTALNETDEAKTSTEQSAAKADDVGQDVAVLDNEITGLRKCADRVRATLIAAESGSDAELRAAVKAMLDNC